MKKLISATEAKNLVSGSDERKAQLIDLINGAIESQAQQGKRWAHLPSSTTEIEQTWLKEELTLAGFTIQDHHPIVNW